MKIFFAVTVHENFPNYISPELLFESSIFRNNGILSLFGTERKFVEKAKRKRKSGCFTDLMEMVKFAMSF